MSTFKKNQEHLLLNKKNVPSCYRVICVSFRGIYYYFYLCNGIFSNFIEIMSYFMSNSFFKFLIHTIKQRKGACVCMHIYRLLRRLRSDMDVL